MKMVLLSIVVSAVVPVPGRYPGDTDGSYLSSRSSFLQRYVRSANEISSGSLRLTEWRSKSFLCRKLSMCAWNGEFLHLTVSQICALYTSNEIEMLVSHLKTEVSQNWNPFPFSLGKSCSTARHREMKMLRLGAGSHSCSPEMLQTEWIPF